MIDLMKTASDYGIAIVVTIMCLGTLISLHLYNVRVTMPNLSDAAEKRLDKLVVAFKDEMSQERNQCQRNHNETTGSLKEVQKALGENQLALIRLLERNGIH